MDTLATEVLIADVLQQAIPPYEQAVRLAVILLAAMVIYMLIRRTGPLMRCVAFPTVTLLFTLLATMVGRPWGLSVEGDAAGQILAWNLFWATILTVRFLDWGVERIYIRRGKTFPVPLLLRRSILVVLYLLAAFVMLKYVLGVDITPLLATSAILTMVIGLALQGVLGNLLSGVSLSLVRTVEVGNLIAVGESEGVVVSTNWRETIIRTRDDDYIHLPNTLLASEKLTNYSKPEQTHRHHIDVGASYSDAPGDVIEALVEAAMEANVTLKDPAPVAYLKGYLDFGINYRLYFWSKNYWSRNRVEGEVGRLVWYKFKRRGIEIPFPMSDELLNDFMAVVYNQRRLPPEEEDVREMTQLLISSSFLTRPSEGEEAPEPMLAGEEVARLAQRCRMIRYTKGEVVTRQGDEGEACYIVSKGSISGSIEYREGGKTHRFAFEAIEGDLYGEMSLFTGMHRTATGLITEETELLEIPREAFACLLAEHEEVMMEIATIVASRNEQNAEFLAKVESLPDEERKQSCDSGVILKRLRNLAAWGSRMIGRG